MLKRTILTLLTLTILFVLPLLASAADYAVRHRDAPGGTYCAVLENDADTATVDFVYISARNYDIVEADIDGGVLASGAFTGEVFATTAALLDLDTDVPVAIIDRTYWNGTTVIDPLPNYAPETLGGLAGHTLLFSAASDASSTETGVNTLLARLTSPRAAVLDDLINGGRLDLLIDGIKLVTDAVSPKLPSGEIAGATELAAVPTAAENADATWDELLAGHTTNDTFGQATNWLKAAFSASGVFEEAALAEAPTGGSAAPDTRDLESVQFTWQLKRSSTGTLGGTNTIVVYPGQTIRASFNCAIPLVLPSGAVLASMTAPTESNEDTTVSELGIDPDEAKVEIVIAADAETTDNPETSTLEGFWVTTSVENSNGGGPTPLFGYVVILDTP